MSSNQVIDVRSNFVKWAVLIGNWIDLRFMTILIKQRVISTLV